MNRVELLTKVLAEQGIDSRSLGHDPDYRLEVAAALEAALAAQESAQESARNSSPAGSPAPTMDPSERANGGTAVASRTGTGPAGEVAAQEGERGGAEVAALGRDAMADVLRPMDRIWNPYTIVDALIAAGYRLIRTTHCNAIGCVDHADGMHVDARGDAIVHIGCDLCRTVPADPAGALATHDAEVWDAGVDAAFKGAITRQNTEDVKRRNPYRIEAQK